MRIELTKVKINIFTLVVCFCAVFILSFPAGSQAEGVVEEEQGVTADLSESMETASELKDKLKIFGWIDAVYKDNKKKRTDSILTPIIST